MVAIEKRAKALLKRATAASNVADTSLTWPDPLARWPVGALALGHFNDQQLQLPLQLITVEAVQRPAMHLIALCGRAKDQQFTIFWLLAN